MKITSSAAFERPPVTHGGGWLLARLNAVDNAGRPLRNLIATLDDVGRIRVQRERRPGLWATLPREQSKPLIDALLFKHPIVGRYLGRIAAEPANDR